MKKTSSIYKKIAIISPLIMLIVGLILYYNILPARYNKVISFIDWLFSGTDNIIATLRSADIVSGQFYKILLTKFIVWVWTIGFIFSLFLCGKAVQNNREANPQAVLIGNVSSNVMDEIMSIVRMKLDRSHSDSAREVYTVLQRLEVRVQALSEFGFGNAMVLAVENQIYDNLKKILVICEDGDVEQDTPRQEILTLTDKTIHLCEKRESMLKHR